MIIRAVSNADDTRQVAAPEDPVVNLETVRRFGFDRLAVLRVQLVALCDILAVLRVQLVTRCELLAVLRVQL